MLGLGSGITVINNLSQMVSAYPSLVDAADSSASAGSLKHGLIKLLACANTLGRLASGAAPERNGATSTRAEFTTWCLLLMGAGMATLILVPDTNPAPLLVLGVAVVGWAFGSLFWAMPTLVMELFGAPHFGANRGIVGLSPAVGGYLLSTKVAGRVYAAAADHGANECVAGGACYRNAWGVNLACVVATGMMPRSRARAGAPRARDRRRTENATGVD